ncbi:MAG: PKD domain-containing protein [Myxococcota bacterium]
MKPLRWMPLIAGMLLILAPGSAEAVDGTITGLSFSPDPADVNQDVTITVQGTQKCKKVGISFGDNTPDVVIDNPDFDNNNTGDDSVTHAYASAGNYVVTASAVDQCNGSAQKTLTVGSSGGGGIKPGLLGSKDLLCAILDNCGKMMIVKDPHKLFMLPPHLESIMIFSVFEPGGAVIVSGERFGATKGELHLYLKTDNKDLKLTVNEWADGAIGATIPYATYGVVDQPAEFYVKKADGTESNRKGPVSFTARRALKNLPRSDVKLAFFGCGNASDCDLCMGGGVDEDDWCFASISPNGTVSGYHSQNCGLVGNDVDTDTYSLKASLKNGWVLHQANIHNQVAPGEGTASASLTSNQIKVKWSISPCDGILYYVNVVLRGPIGTDH